MFSGGTSVCAHEENSNDFKIRIVFFSFHFSYCLDKSYSDTFQLVLKKRAEP